MSRVDRLIDGLKTRPVAGLHDRAIRRLTAGLKRRLGVGLISQTVIKIVICVAAIGAIVDRVVIIDARVINARVIYARIIDGRIVDVSSIVVYRGIDRPDIIQILDA